MTYNRTTDAVPTPGSIPAIKAGCLCPIDKNENGLGVNNGDGTETFWVETTCTVHGKWKQEKLLVAAGETNETRA